MTRRAVYTLAILLMASPAFAQFSIPGLPQIVFDPRALAQTSVTAAQAKLTVEQLILMSSHLPGMAQYRVPGLPPPPIFLPRTLEHLVRIYLPQVLPPLIASHVTVIDTIDEIIFRAQHHVGNARALDEMMAPALQALERDVTELDPSRSLTSALDAMNASQLLARRQGQADQSILASLLELEALKAQRDRDAEFAALLIRAGHMAPREYISDEGDPTAWARWSLPER